MQSSDSNNMNNNSNRYYCEKCKKYISVIGHIKHKQECSIIQNSIINSSQGLNDGMLHLNFSQNAGLNINEKLLIESSKGSLINMQSQDLFNEADINKIPCEFCDALIIASDYNNHTDTCNNNPRYIESLKEVMIPCEICEQQIDSKSYENHVKQCNKSSVRHRNSQDNDQIDRRRSSFSIISQPNNVDEEEKRDIPLFSINQIQHTRNRQNNNQRIEQMQIEASDRADEGEERNQRNSNNNNESDFNLNGISNSVHLLFRILNETFLSDLDSSSNTIAQNLQVVKFDMTKFKSLDEESRKCVICLTAFEHEEEIKFLPCTHRFHCECVDAWLKKHTNCPLCKKDFSEYQ